MVLTEQQVREKLKTYAPLVQKYDSPISVATRLAQLIVESQMFTSELALKSNNGFGIKASAPWTGDSVPHVSGEVGGARESEFRKYPSHEASIKDHAEFFTSTPFRQTDKVYGLAIKATNYKDEAKYLGPKFKGDKSSYAGDPNYAAKLIDKVERYNLTQYDKGEDYLTQLRTPIKRHTLVNKGGRIGQIKYIVIHFVGAAGQARANADYFYNVLRNASAHLFIDKNVTYEVVPENTVAWHVGDGRGRYGITNNNSLGIEGCQDTSTGKNVWHWDFHPETYKQMLLQTSAWMDKYNVPIERVVRHYDASRKVCPGNWQWNDWAKWWKFKSDLKALREGKSVAGITGGAPQGNKYNPKGYTESPAGDYRPPVKPFEDVKVGDTVTIRQGCNWFNPQMNNFIVSPKVADHYGKQYKIIDEKEVSASYSKKAVLLDGVQSWLLIQDLEEPRANWGNIKSASKYVVEKGDYLHKIAEEFDTTVADIKKWNNLDTNVIHVGQVLFIIEPQEVAEDVHQEPESVPDGIEKKEDQPQDKGEETKAIELQEGELMDWKGNIYARISK